MDSLQTRRNGPGSYAMYSGKVKVGEIDKTGTHLDFYPWDWMVIGFKVKPRPNGLQGAVTGAADTLRAAKSEVEQAWRNRVEE